MSFTYDDLPYEVHCVVMSYIPPPHISEVASVCKYWNDAVGSLTAWIMRLKHCNVYAEEDILQYLSTPEKLKQYYRVCTGNMLSNVNMDEGKEDFSGRRESDKPNFRGWSEIAGDWALERHIGADPYPSEAGSGFNNPVASYMVCGRSQKLHLSSIFPDHKVLLENGFQFNIVWHVWLAPRYDCKSKYYAYLYRQGLPIEKKSNRLSDIDLARVEIPAGTKWVKHSRTVNLTSDNDNAVWTYAEEGSDGQFWSGHYGVKIFNPTIRVQVVPGQI